MRDLTTIEGKLCALAVKRALSSWAQDLREVEERGLEGEVERAGEIVSTSRVGRERCVLKNKFETRSLSAQK